MKPARRVRRDLRETPDATGPEGTIGLHRNPPQRQDRAGCVGRRLDSSRSCYRRDQLRDSARIGADAPSTSMKTARNSRAPKHCTPAVCTGSAVNPTAPEGTLCVYATSGRENECLHRHQRITEVLPIPVCRSRRSAYDNSCDSSPATADALRRRGICDQRKHRKRWPRECPCRGHLGGDGRIALTCVKRLVLRGGPARPGEPQAPPTTVSLTNRTQAPTVIHRFDRNTRSSTKGTKMTPSEHNAKPPSAATGLFARLRVFLRAPGSGARSSHQAALLRDRATGVRGRAVRMVAIVALIVTGVFAIAASTASATRRVALNSN